MIKKIVNSENVYYIKEFINNNLDNQISFDKMNIKLVVKNKEEE